MNRRRSLSRKAAETEPELTDLGRWAETEPNVDDMLLLVASSKSNNFPASYEFNEGVLLVFGRKSYSANLGKAALEPSIVVTVDRDSGAVVVNTNNVRWPKPVPPPTSVNLSVEPSLTYSPKNVESASSLSLPKNDSGEHGESRNKIDFGAAHKNIGAESSNTEERDNEESIPMHPQSLNHQSPVRASKRNAGISSSPSGKPVKLQSNDAKQDISGSSFGANFSHRLRQAHGLSPKVEPNDYCLHEDDDPILSGRRCK